MLAGKREVGGGVELLVNMKKNGQSFV